MSDPFQQFGRGVSTGSRRVVQSWQYASRQPSWVLRAALITFLLVFAVPIVLLVLTAVLAAAVVFLLLAGVYMLFEKARAALRGDGRKNVRVIQRRE